MIHNAARPASLPTLDSTRPRLQLVPRQKTLACRSLLIYTFCVHNNSSAAALQFRRPSETIAKATVRKAVASDVAQITRLVNAYAAEGLMLPRTEAQIAARIDSYVVAGYAPGEVVACAALEEYSPSLAEVSSVAVANAEHGKGLGTQVVLGVERLARTRDIEELFAMSLTDEFFLSLDYAPASIARYPEKLLRYETLAKEGVQVVPKRCYSKSLSASSKVPRLVESAKPTRKKRKAS